MKGHVPRPSASPMAPSRLVHLSRWRSPVLRRPATLGPGSVEGIEDRRLTGKPLPGKPVGLITIEASVELEDAGSLALQVADLAEGRRVVCDRAPAASPLKHRSAHRPSAERDAAGRCGSHSRYHLRAAASRPFPSHPGVAVVESVLDLPPGPRPGIATRTQSRTPSDVPWPLGSASSCCLPCLVANLGQESHCVALTDRLLTALVDARDRVIR